MKDFTTFGHAVGEAIHQSAAQRVFEIVMEVANKHRITHTQITSQRRSRCYSWPRQEAMWRASVETPASHRTIARLLGLQHPSTVIHGIRAHAKRMSEPPRYPQHPQIAG